ncbi:hypothetical protein UlMin_044139 [Ulmus minor]
MNIQKRSFVDDIPDEIVIKILSKLPAKTLRRCMCVCKEWKSLIVDLINTHLRQSSATKYSIIPYGDLSDRLPKLLLLRDKIVDDLEIPIFKCLQLDDETHVFTFIFVGSCNGLVCFSHCEDCTVIWNPITGDKQLIPKPMLDSNHNKFDYHLSFGFDHINNDYKLVKVMEDYNTLELRIQIFHLSTNSWRKVKGFFGYTLALFSTFEIVNGVLYLMGSRHIRETEINNCILQFNFCNEEFQEILDLPSTCKNGGWIKLSKWKESLALVERLSEKLYEEIEYNFWIMNNEQAYSWTKLFKISGCGCYGNDYKSLFLGTYKDQLVFDKYVKATNQNELTLLDVGHHKDYMNNHTTLKNFGTSDPMFSFNTFDYVESLIPVNHIS